MIVDLLLHADGFAFAAGYSRRLEASFALWEVHLCKPSTNVLKPLKLGALREVARYNILLLAEYHVPVHTTQMLLTSAFVQNRVTIMHFYLLRQRSRS